MFAYSYSNGCVAVQEQPISIPTMASNSLEKLPLTQKSQFKEMCAIFIINEMLQSKFRLFAPTLVEL